MHLLSLSSQPTLVNQVTCCSTLALILIFEYCFNHHQGWQLLWRPKTRLLKETIFELNRESWGWAVPSSDKAVLARLIKLSCIIRGAITKKNRLNAGPPSWWGWEALVGELFWRIFLLIFWMNCVTVSTTHFSPSNDFFLPVMNFFSQQCHFHLLSRLGHRPSAWDSPPPCFFWWWRP